MKRIIAVFGLVLACAIAMNSVCAAAETIPKPTDADKKGLAEAIQKRYKPGPGSTSPGTQKMEAGTTTTGKCGPTGQIAACSVACAASCIFDCMPSRANWTGSPWSSACHGCVNTCMDKCTGCGSGKLE
jgi:hypothetical protein